MSRHSNSTTHDLRSHPQEPKTSIVTRKTIHFLIPQHAGIWSPSKNNKISNIKSLVTKAVLSVSRHNISTTYDLRSHPEQPRRSIVTPNRIIIFRFYCKLAFGIPQKILEYLMEDLHQLILYLCPGILFQPHITTKDTNRNPKQA